MEEKNKTGKRISNVLRYICGVFFILTGFSGMLINNILAGFLLNKQINEITFSPIYDCGSCLNPLLEDTELENMNSAEIKNY